MFNRANLLIVAIAVLGAAVGLLVSAHTDDLSSLFAPADAAASRPGDKRLDLDLHGLDGAPRRLSEFDGKLVLLNFWASWCEPCREEMPLLNAARAKYAGNGLEIVGIAIDDIAPVQGFLRDHAVQYPILMATGDLPNPAQRYGDSRSVLPYSVLIGRDGKVLAQRAGNFSEAGLADWLKAHL